MKLYRDNDSYQPNRYWLEYCGLTTQIYNESGHCRTIEEGIQHFEAGGGIQFSIFKTQPKRLTLIGEFDHKSKYFKLILGDT